MCCLYFVVRERQGVITNLILNIIAINTSSTTNNPGCRAFYGMYWMVGGDIYIFGGMAGNGNGTIFWRGERVMLTSSFSHYVLLVIYY
jgi:hypothetical protein